MDKLLWWIHCSNDYIATVDTLLQWIHCCSILIDQKWKVPSLKVYFKEVRKEFHVTISANKATFRNFF